MTDNTGQSVPVAKHLIKPVFNTPDMIPLRQNVKPEETAPVWVTATAIFIYNQKRHLETDALIFYAVCVIS